MLNDTPLPATPSTRSRLPLWGGLLVLFLLVPAIGVPILLTLFAEPAFQSFDELNPADIRSMEIFVLNRPDRGPDIGKIRILFPIAEADHPLLLAHFLKAKRVDSLPPKVWLGRLVVKLANGKKQDVLLYRVGDENDAKNKVKLLFKIGPYQYEARAADPLTLLLDECVAKE